MHIKQTRQLLCKIYDMDHRTLAKKLREYGITHRGHLTPIDLEIFVNKYGTPEQLKQVLSRIR